MKILLATLAVTVAVTACKAPDRRIADFADAWGAADFERAEEEIDALVADEAGVEPKVVTDSRGLDPTIDPKKGDTFLFLQEKSMTRLASGDTDGTIELLRRSRDVLSERYNESDVAGWLQAAIADDTFLDYRGADYEHVLTPAMLAICDLLEGGQDSYAYALQVGEVQERILGSTFGDDVDGKGNGYNPRKTYQRVAVGAYVEGLVREREGYASEAFKAYERARDWGGSSSAVVVDACERTTNGVYSGAGQGVVHVFRLAGRGPRFVQGTSPMTDAALFLANIGSLVVGDNVGLLGQMNVPIPVVRVGDPFVPELEIRTGGAVVASTSTLLDVAAVATQQIEANMPWILARAAIRRGAKAVAAKAVQDSTNSNDSGIGLLAGVLTNLALTAGEQADTRNWTSLPARFQAARFTLPEGDHELDLGGGMHASVRVASGKDSYVVIVQPDLARPGAVVTDVYSRPASANP